MLKTEILSSEREAEYEKFLLNDERVLFNSNLKFRKLMRRVTKAEDYYLIALEDNKIVGTLPVFLFTNGKYGNVLNSLPWYGSNPGISINPAAVNREEIKISLLNMFNKLAIEKKAVTSTIITRPFEVDIDLFKKYSEYNYLDSRVGLVTQLPEPSNHIDSDVMKSFHSKTRNLVRKAQKSEMTFYHDDSEETFKFLVDTHRQNMEAVGAPPKDDILFNGVRELFDYDDDYRIYIAELNGNKIAALLLKYYAKTVDYFTPAIVTEYRSYQPLNLLIFNAMIDASKNGYKYWNWGGTTLPSQEGVYHFKKRMGADECEYFYYTRAYGDIEHLLSLEGSTLLKEYPYFFVLPFSELKS